MIFYYNNEFSDYDKTLQYMKNKVNEIHNRRSDEIIYFAIHPNIYTIGITGSVKDIINNPQNIPVYKTNRGGRVTYHGPGQLVIYAMLNLYARSIDVSSYICKLQNWIAESLKIFGVLCYTQDNIGIWTKLKEKPIKIGSIGLRITHHGISYHGVSINISNDMSFFKDIIPCGLDPEVMSSMKDLGIHVSCEDVMKSLKATFYKYFDDNRS